MSTWWESNSGLEFRRALKHFAATPTFKDALLFIFNKTEIEPSVVKKWKKGGTPSIKNIKAILDACGCTNTKEIIDSLREFKNKVLLKLIENSHSRPSSIISLKAIITDDPESDKYWVRVYNNDKFVYGDRTSYYNYAFKMINTPKYRKGIVDKLGHNNFSVQFDLGLSVPNRGAK